MLSGAQKRAIYEWGHGKAIDLDKLFAIGDSLKNAKAGRSLVIIAPSHLMRRVVKDELYNELIDSDKVDKMTVNKGMYLPRSEEFQYYLPFTTHGATAAVNKQQDYVEWMNRFAGLVMHGMHVRDSTNPYILATPNEIKDIIKKCPNAELMLWRHCWGKFLQKGTMAHRMCEFPHYEQWTPSKIPWAHCGAISGFAIPLAMTLGYKNIYLVCMGYDNVLNAYNDPPRAKILSQSKIKRRGLWIKMAPRRFKNQAILAKKHGVNIKVGPINLIEKELLKFYEPFGEIKDILGEIS